MKRNFQKYMINMASSLKVNRQKEMPRVINNMIDTTRIDTGDLELILEIMK